MSTRVFSLPRNRVLAALPPFGVAPRCPDLAVAVGNTPVLRIGAQQEPGTRGYWAKLEGHNPGGIKDRPALHMVARARQRGVLRPGGLIVESTSGTMGLGLALAGIVYGHPVAVVTDPDLEPIMRRLLTAYGVRIEVVPEPHPTGGWQQARKRRVDELLAEHPDAWSPDQYHNPDHVTGYLPLALELVAQLGRIDVLVCSVGTGGHSAGVSAVLRQFFPRLRLIGVDTVGSVIFGQPQAPRLMRGLGSSIHPGNVAYDAFDEVHWVGPAEAAWTCRRLAASHYASGGWSVGAVALVADWVARREPPTTAVAAIFPDGPQRYFDTIYDDSFCARHELLAGPPPSEPDVLADPAERTARSWARCTTVINPQWSDIGT